MTRAKSNKQESKPEVKQKPFHFNFELVPELCQGGIYIIELPVGTKITGIVEYSKGTTGGQFIKDYKQKWNIPILTCERPQEDFNAVQKRQFTLVDILDPEILNAMDKELVYVGAMNRVGVITTDVLKLWEIK